MGCTHSSGKKIKIVKETGGGKIQDEARSYRSKVGAGKLVLKNETIRSAFKKFIETEGNGDGRTEFITYFEAMEQMKPLAKEEQVLRVRKILELTLTPPQTTDEERTTTRNQLNSILYASLRPLRPLKLDKATPVEISKAINATQDLLIAAVTPEFERFIASEEFCELKKTNLENHKTVPVKQTPVVGKTKANKTTSTTIAPPRMESGFLGIGPQ